MQQSVFILTLLFKGSDFTPLTMSELQEYIDDYQPVAENLLKELEGAIQQLRTKGRLKEISVLFSL